MKSFFLGFEKRASTKATYKKVDFTTLNPTNKDEIWSVKIDGAHSVVDLQKGKLPRLFSHRISRRTGDPIEYTQKLPHISRKSPFDAKVRTEVFAERDGTAVHPDIVSAMLNRGVERSLDLQKELGIKTKTALIDVDSFQGKDMSGRPYKEKLKVLKMIARRNPDFILPDMASSKLKKEQLYKKMGEGLHPQSKEGLVVHNLNDPTRPFAKAKIIDHHDVYVTGIFKEKGVKQGRKSMAGGFYYSWEPGGNPAGRVGTGFDHNMKEDMLRNPGKYIGRAAKVKALDVSKNKVLVKPSFDGWHIEKNIS